MQKIVVEGGRILGVDGCARGRGTTVEVRDLFFNPPAIVGDLNQDPALFVVSCRNDFNRAVFVDGVFGIHQ